MALPDVLGRRRLANAMAAHINGAGLRGGLDDLEAEVVVELAPKLWVVLPGSR